MRQNNNSRLGKKFSNEKRILDYPEITRPPKSILDRPKKILDQPKFSTDKKVSRPVKNILDRQESFSTGQKILDREKISRPVKKYSIGQKISQPTRTNLERSIAILKGWICISLDGMTSGLVTLKNNLDHFCPLWLSIASLKIVFTTRENVSRPARRVMMAAYYRYILQNKGIQKSIIVKELQKVRGRERQF